MPEELLEYLPETQTLVKAAAVLVAWIAVTIMLVQVVRWMSRQA